MTGHWQAVADFLAHALLAGGGVLLIGFLLGKSAATPARRQYVAGWTVRGAVVAAGLCLLPSWITIPAWVGRVAPAATVEAIPAAVDPVEEDVSEEAIPEFGDMMAVSVEVPAEPIAEVIAVTPPVESRSIAWRAALPYACWAYLVVGMALLGQLAVGHLALWWLRQSASPPPSRLRAVFEEFTLADGLETTLVVSDRIDAPVCFGVLRPTVVLPRRLALDASIDELRWVLAHELDHLRRGDPATAVWAGVARGLFFVWPWYWAVRRDLTLSQEYLADAAAAAAGGQPADYAAFLVDLSDPAVTGRSVTLLAAHAVRAKRSDLFRRVNMVLRSDVNRRVSRGWAVVAGCGVMSAAIGFSGLGWAAADDDKPRPEAGQKDKPRSDADRDDAPPPKPPAPPRRDGERRETFEFRVGDRPQGEEIGKLKRQIEEATKDGRTDEVMKLVNQLERALMPRRVEVREIRPVPPVAPLPPVPPGQGQWRFDLKDVGPLNAQAREGMEKALKVLEQQAEKLGDQKEAQQALRAAMDKLRADLEKSGTLRLNQQYFPQGAGGVGGVTGVFGTAGGAGGGMNVFVRPMAGRFGVAVGRVPEAVYEQVELTKGTGLLAVEVAGGSAADKAGVRKNDIIVRFAGKEVPNDERRFIEVVGAAKPGEEIEVIVLRKGKKESLTAKLPEPPKPAEPRRTEPKEGRDRGAKATFEKRSVMISDDKFDIKATKDDVAYKLTGRVEEGRAVAEKIVVTDDDKTKEYKSLKDVPEQYQAAVRQLLGAVSGR